MDNNISIFGTLFNSGYPWNTLRGKNYNNIQWQNKDMVDYVHWLVVWQILDAGEIFVAVKYIWIKYRDW